MIKNFFSILVDNFAPLRQRHIRIYISGQAISLIGTWVQQTAQSWVVWNLAHNASALGTVALVGQIPFFLLGPIAGVWADRFNRRKILIGTQFVSMLLAFALAFLVQENLAQLWHVYLLALLLGVVSALDLPSQQAFIGDISGMEHVRKTIVINNSFVQLSRMIGPAIAGWLIASLGVSMAFWLNGISFLAVIFSLLILTSHQVTKPSSESHWNDFIEGLRFIGRDVTVISLFVFITLLTFFGFSVIQILPAVTGKILHGNADVLGLLMGSSGAGALVSTIFIVPVAQRMKKPLLILAGSVIWSGTWYLTFSFSHSVALSMFCLFAAGLSGALVFTMSTGLLQVLAPHHMRARVMSAMLMITFGLQPVAALIIGYFADIFGVLTIIFFNGLSMIIFSLLMLIFVPKVRSFIVA